MLASCQTLQFSTDEEDNTDDSNFLDEGCSSDIQCIYLKTPRIAMELVRCGVSSRLGARLANIFLLDIQAMDLLKENINEKTYHFC